MSTRSEAVVIPFPARTEPATPNSAQLGRALTGLAQALAAQQSAIAAWRDRLEQLQTSDEGLDQSVHCYAARLCTLRHDIGLLGRQAEQLSRMAGLAGES